MSQEFATQIAQSLFAEAIAADGSVVKRVHAAYYTSFLPTFSTSGAGTLELDFHWFRQQEGNEEIATATLNVATGAAVPVLADWCEIRANEVASLALVVDELSVVGKRYI